MNGEPVGGTRLVRLSLAASVSAALVMAGVLELRQERLERTRLAIAAEAAALAGVLGLPAGVHGTRAREALAANSVAPSEVVTIAHRRFALGRSDRIEVVVARERPGPLGRWFGRPPARITVRAVAEGIENHERAGVAMGRRDWSHVLFSESPSDATVMAGKGHTIEGDVLIRGALTVSVDPIRIAGSLRVHGETRVTTGRLEVEHDLEVAPARLLGPGVPRVGGAVHETPPALPIPGLDAAGLKQAALDARTYFEYDRVGGVWFPPDPPPGARYDGSRIRWLQAPGPIVGTYWIEGGDLEFGVPRPAGRAVLVATGLVSLGGPGMQMSAGAMFRFVSLCCCRGALTVKLTRSRLRALLYARCGSVEVRADDLALDGAIVGHEVETIEGTGITIRHDPAVTAGFLIPPTWYLDARVVEDRVSVGP